MENDYRITKLHGTFIGDNRIPDLPVGEKTKVFSSTNGKTAWVDLPEGGIPIVEAEFSEELNSFILPTEQTTNFILHEESAGYYYINCIGGVAYSGFCPIAGSNIAYSLSGSGTMITLSTPVVLNIVSGTIGSNETITIPSEQTGPFILSLELIGNIYVETYEAATTKYYGLSYRKDDEGDKLLILNGEGTTLTAKTCPLSGGGSSISPCLKLVDMENGSIRTSITEEEKNNIEKGLYNSVVYADPSISGSEYSAYFPETALSILGDFGFSAYDISVDEASGTITIPGTSLYTVHIGDKNADGTYPISITKEIVANFGSGGGSSTPSTSIAFQDVTVSELANHVGKFENLHITDLKYTYTLGSYTQTCTGAYFIGTVASDTQISGSLWFTVSENIASYIDSKTFSISNNTITYDLGKQSLGAIESISWPLNINSTDGFNLLWNTIDGGDVIYAGDVNGKTTASYLALAYTSIYPSAEGEETFARLTGLFKEFGYGVMDLKKDSNNTPQFKSFTTWLPPVTANSDGKALIVTDGNAQWTTTPRYEHTITIKNSAGKILWTQTMRNSSNTVVNSYANLKTLFGEATYAGFGEYCQLNLEGGTEATDKLIKADGTEVTLASLGAIVYTDKCFLPK